MVGPSYAIFEFFTHTVGTRNPAPPTNFDLRLPLLNDSLAQSVLISETFIKNRSRLIQRLSKMCMVGPSYAIFGFFAHTTRIRSPAPWSIFDVCLPLLAYFLAQSKLILESTSQNQ